MFVLGHLGIGSWVAARRVRAEQLAWLLFGTLLADLVDKPLYYALVLATGRRGAELGLVTGTRTFGHTLLLVVALWLLLPRRIGTPVALGMITHPASGHHHRHPVPVPRAALPGVAVPQRAGPPGLAGERLRARGRDRRRGPARLAMARRPFHTATACGERSERKYASVSLSPGSMGTRGTQPSSARARATSGRRRRGSPRFTGSSTLLSARSAMPSIRSARPGSARIA